MRRPTIFALAALVLTAAAALPLAARADDATAHYHEGARLLQEGKPDAALVELDASLAARPSANTELLRAHALRLLGRRVEALEAYARVERAAGASVRAGDEKYRPTLEDAGRWLALLRNELGEVAITVARSGSGATITVDGRAVASSRDPGSSTLRARVWHEPGRAVVGVVPSGGAAEQRFDANVVAGAVASVDAAGAPPPSSPVPRDVPSSAPPAAAWVAWSVGVVGLGTFAIFGARAQSAADDLDECRPKCTDVGKADSGQRDETIANVGLAFGALGVVGGGIAWLVSLASSDDASAPSATTSSTVRVRVAPAHGGVSGGIGATF